MLIDWFTVAAQALNFIILLWLMKHFLFKPIVNAIDAREKRIAAELADADAKKAEARKERDEFTGKNEKFDSERASLLGRAVEEVKVERQRLLEEARKAADALSAKRGEALRNEAHSLDKALRHRTQQQVFAMTRKALADLATTSLEERVVEVFTRRLRELTGPAKAQFGEALKASSDPALVRSAFELPAAQRAAIQNALNESFAAEVRVRFETAPEIISGIELTANGLKLGWSIAEYLTSLEESVEQLLKKQERPAAEPEPSPAEPSASSRDR